MKAVIPAASREFGYGPAGFGLLIGHARHLPGT
jgi:hypothetical protein